MIFDVCNKMKCTLRWNICTPCAPLFFIATSLKPALSTGSISVDCG